MIDRPHFSKERRICVMYFLFPNPNARSSTSGPPEILDREFPGVHHPEIPEGNSREFFMIRYLSKKLS